LPINWEGGPYSESRFHIRPAVAGAILLLLVAVFAAFISLAVGVGLFLLFFVVLWWAVRKAGGSSHQPRYILSPRAAMVVDARTGQRLGECDLCDPNTPVSVVITNLRDIPMSRGQNQAPMIHHVGNVNFLRNGSLVLSFRNVEHPEGPRDMASEIINSCHRQFDI